MAPVSPYETAIALQRPVPGHITAQADKDRVTAYWTYDDIYNNVTDAFVRILRDDSGDEISRRLVPAARTIIEATNRYLGKDITITPLPLSVDPLTGAEVAPNETAVQLLMNAINNFLARERFFSKFISLKRWMLVRGDAVFHLMADDTKPEGTRLRLVEVHPASYFPKPNAIDPERLDGVYLVTVVDDDEGEPIAQRQSYLKMENGTIFTKLEFFEEEAWDDRWPLTEDDLAPVDAPSRYADSPLLAGFELPSQITSIPVYLYRNPPARESYGVSEIQGIETLLAGIMQTASDQDVTVVLTGIGVYTTTSGTPRDSQGNEQPWVIAPASVLELQDKDDKFDRVSGVTSIAPLLDHLSYLQNKAQETTGTPDIAVGKVDLKVQQSGVALAIQMSPILSKNEEKEVELKTVMQQLFYDIVNMWLPAYEGIDPGGITLNVTFGDPMPVNRVEVLAEITELLKANIISIEFAQKLVVERLGYEIPADMLASVVAEQGQLLDATGTRLEEAATEPEVTP
jgi:Phage portal protein, SPP1 Gp6-like